MEFLIVLSRCLISIMQVFACGKWINFTNYPNCNGELCYSREIFKETLWRIIMLETIATKGSREGKVSLYPGLVVMGWRIIPLETWHIDGVFPTRIRLTSNRVFREFRESSVLKFSLDSREILAKFQLGNIKYHDVRDYHRNCTLIAFRGSGWYEGSNGLRRPRSFLNQSEQV